MVTPSGIVTDVKLVQSQNAYFPMEVTLEGIVTEVKLVQSSNAYAPMEVTPSVIVTDVKFEQPLNAEDPMEVTGRPPRVEGMVIAPLVDVGQSVIEDLPFETW